MANKTEIKARLAFWKDVLVKLQEAYIALLDSRVQSYQLGEKQLTRLDLNSLQRRIEDAEEKIDELTALLENGAKWKAVGVVHMDW